MRWHVVAFRDFDIICLLLAVVVGGGGINISSTDLFQLEEDAMLSETKDRLPIEDVQNSDVGDMMLSAHSVGSSLVGIKGESFVADDAKSGSCGVVISDSSQAELTSI